jgi:O-antigen ligase
MSLSEKVPPVGSLVLWALLALPLVLSPLVGLLTPYLSLLIILPLFVVTIARGRFAAAYASYGARALLLVFIVLAVLFALTADSARDVLSAFNFTMLLCYGAILHFLGERAAAGNAERVAQFAGLGVLIGFVEVVASLLGGSPRPTAINLGPIVLSNGLLALGFISLGGALVRHDRFAAIYLAAPVLAVAATLLTGSRGPLIALPFSIGAAAVFFWRARPERSARAVLIGGFGLAVVAGAAAALGMIGRSGSLFRVFEVLASGGEVTDSSTVQRFALYRAGWQSFLESPWIGHGWANMMASVKPLLDPSERTLSNLPQLHNDVLNFAVAAGAAGVLCWLVIISTPIVGAIRSSHDDLRTFRLYGATVLTITYLGGGLTDLMFGFEFHTFLFVMLTAILLGYCRGPRMAQ